VAAPSTPAAPTTTISGSNVMINWVTPADGGSTITGYEVTIRQSDGLTYAIYGGCTGTAVICEIPISVLRATPYSLTDGASVFAKVLAKNAISSSVYSLPGNGAAINVITIPSVPETPTTKIVSNTSV